MKSFKEAFMKDTQTIARIETLIDESYSIREVLLNMEVRDSAHAYRKFREFCDINFIKYEFSQTARIRRYKTIEEYLIPNSTHRLNKQRLIDENILELKCYGENCSLSSEWLGKKLVLELDHINGDSSDNRRENIRFLCPNCHSQQPTSHKRKNYPITVIKKYFCECGEERDKKAILCSVCAASSREKIIWPLLEELIQMVVLHGKRGTGKILGVSDNAINKRIKNQKKRLASL